MAGPEFTSLMPFNPRGTLCSRCFLGPSFLAQTGFSLKMAVISKKPRFKFSLSVHWSPLSEWARDPWAEFPSNPASMEPFVALLKSPIQVKASTRQRCLGNWQIYSPVAAVLFRGEAWLLLQQADLDVCLLFPKCEHCWRCTSQMEVISFEVVPLEAQEQSNCINSSIWVEKAEEGTRLDWAEVKKTEQRYTSPWLQGAREPKEVSLTAFK